MTLMNDQSALDLKTYTKKTMWSAIILVVLISLLFISAYYFNATQFYGPCAGGLLGVLCATLNLFAIGYAFYGIAVKGGKRWVLFLPIITFIAMCSIAYLMANYWPALILGFALGLTAPIVFGASIIFFG